MTNNHSPDDDDKAKMDPYHMEGLHGTLAPVSNQEHYDTRGDILTFDDTLVGRSAELAQLQSVYYGQSSTIETNSNNDSTSRVVFIGGYSGVGKSSLIRQFVNEIIQSSSPPSNGSNLIFAEGKFQFHHSQSGNMNIPFSAFHDLMSRLMLELECKGLVERVQMAIYGSDEIGREGIRVLKETWPVLAGLVKADVIDNSEGDKNDGGSDAKVMMRRLSSTTISMNAIKEYTLLLLTLICDGINDHTDIQSKNDTNEAEKISSATKQDSHHPLMILFLDDLQWADIPSLELLQHLLLEGSSLRERVVFLCAYRSNEVGEDHPLMRVISDVTESKLGVENDNNVALSAVGRKDMANSNNINPYRMELYPLPPSTIQQFLAQTLSKDPSDVTHLSQVIYKKTMGNIFYVRQAVEELVRKNALYYDTICFEWMFAESCSSDMLEEYISDDVVESVKGKIGMLEDMLRHVLIVMGYVPNTLELKVLRRLLRSTGREIADEELVQLLNSGVGEGLLLLSSENGLYVIAHDKIRQASIECIEDKERDEMLLQLANALIVLYEEDETKMEWCIYVAVNFFNSFEPRSKTDVLELAGLNLKVAACARKKGDMDKEYRLLSYSLECLHSASKVWDEYELTLKIYNGLIKSAEVLGKFDESRSHVKEVLDHASNQDDKLIAYRYKVILTYVETRDYNESLKEGIRILKMYGYDFKPNPSAADCFKEEMKVKLALHKGSYSCILDQPLVENPLTELFVVVARQSSLSGKDKLLKLICLKAIQMGLSKGIDHHFHTILALLGYILAKEKNIKVACDIANTAVLMSEKSREERGSAFTKVMAFQGVLLQLQSFRSGVDVLLQCFKDLKLGGQNDPALGAALCHSLAVFASGMTIGPLVESKLLIFEGFAKKSGLDSWCSVFQMQRQFLLNLWKTSDNPTELNGCAFNEEGVLSSLDSSSAVYSSTRRDTSTFRMILAFVYQDDDCMTRMLEILHEYPPTDPAVPRLHLRLAYMGLSALFLSQRTKNKNFREISDLCLAHFKDLTKLGSVNAKPVYHFMRALKNPSTQSFESAISSCAEAQCSHLEAMSKEHYGLYLCQDRNIAVGQDYLVSSYWSYCDWGAHAKSCAMQDQYPYIKTASRDEVNSRIQQALSNRKGKDNRFGPMKILSPKNMRSMRK